MNNVIKENIQRWNELRNLENGFKILNGGNVIGLSQMNFEQMQINSSEFLHFYIGVTEETPEQQPIFYMVGNEYDIKEKIDMHLDKVCALHFQPPPFFNIMPNTLNNTPDNIDINISAIRSFKWFLYKKDWFESAKNDNQVVRAFKIPIASVKNIFNDTSVQNILIFFGISWINTGYNIDLIFCNSTSEIFEIPEMFENLTMPCPPYNCGDFGLMNF
ncbi:MAG: hypothetical protein ACI8ZM_002622 [Crocinitomix sp.]|jgi:hypothetical protein